MESKFDKVVKKLNEEIDQLQFDLNNAKTDYFNLLNSGSLKKKKSLGLTRHPSTHLNSQLSSQETYFPSNLPN